MQTTTRGLVTVLVTTGYFWLDATPRKKYFEGPKKCSGAPIPLGTQRIIPCSIASDFGIDILSNFVQKNETKRLFLPFGRPEYVVSSE